MAYILLGLAIGLELLATTLLKYSAGFTRPWPTLGCLLSYISCFYLLSKALNTINLGVAYATWSAVGIVVTSIISVALFGEKVNLTGVMSLILITSGCILLNLYGTTSK